jgi:hypothetical protein
MPSPPASRVDVITFRSMAATGPDGSIELEAGLALLNAIRRVLSAAARATGSVRLPYYAQANRSLVSSYLSTARLGPTGKGGSVVEILSQLPGRAEAGEPSLFAPVGLTAGPGQQPLQRRVNLRLLEAADALGAAAEQYRVTGALDAFHSSVDVGVSAELCEAAAGLLDAGGDVDLQLVPAIDWPMTDPGSIVTRATFRLVHRDLLREVGGQLKNSMVADDVELRGRITNLERRSTRDGPGTITLAVVDPDPVATTVKVSVGPQRYDDAITAHRSHRSVIVRGGLVRHATVHWVHSPVAFRIGPTLIEPHHDTSDGADIDIRGDADGSGSAPRAPNKLFFDPDTDF